MSYFLFNQIKIRVTFFHISGTLNQGPQVNWPLRSPSPILSSPTHDQRSQSPKSLLNNDVIPEDLCLGDTEPKNIHTPRIFILSLSQIIEKGIVQQIFFKLLLKWKSLYNILRRLMRTDMVMLRFEESILLWFWKSYTPNLKATRC